MHIENKEKSKLIHYMRSLHRDIGFLLIGLTFIYSISGVILIYRDTDFLKSEQTIERQLSPGMKEADIKMALHMREFKVQKTEGDVEYFKEGYYNNKTGLVKYTTRALPLILEKFTGLHKTASSNFAHWFSMAFGILLLFLAISSFWMFKPSSKPFRRGITFAGIGFLFAVGLLIMI